MLFMIDSGFGMDVNFVVCVVVSNCFVFFELSVYDFIMKIFFYISSCRVRLKRLWYKCWVGWVLFVMNFILFLFISMSFMLEEFYFVDKFDVDDLGGVIDIGFLVLIERFLIFCILKLKLVFLSFFEYCLEVVVMELVSSCKYLMYVEFSNFKRLSDLLVYEFI